MVDRQCICVFYPWPFHCYMMHMQGLYRPNAHPVTDKQCQITKEENDRQVATCPQLGSTDRLKHVEVRPGIHSFPAKSATLAGRCRPGSVQSLRPGVQMSAQDGS